MSITDNKKMQHNQRSIKQLWVKKSDLHCNITRTSLKAVEDIIIDLCGDTSSVQVDVSTTHTDVGGVEESSKKLECRGRIPSFFLIPLPFLAKKGWDFAKKCQRRRLLVHLIVGMYF